MNSKFVNSTSFSTIRFALNSLQFKNILNLDRNLSYIIRMQIGASQNHCTPTNQ